MTRRLGFLSAFLLAVGVLSVLLLRDAFVAPPPAPDPALPAAPSTVDRAAAEAALRQPAAAPGRTALPAAADVARRSATVQVFDRATSQPVAGAEVVADPAVEPGGVVDPGELRRQAREYEPFQRLQRLGQHATTDAEGRVRLAFRPWLQVCARAPGRYGQTVLPADEPPEGHRLWLEAEASARVRVVDARGRGLPAVPLALSAEFVLPGAVAGDRETWSAAVTDADGRAEFAHLQLLAQDRRGRRCRDLHVLVQAPGLCDVAAPLVAGAEPVLLVLPPHGGLAVHVVDRRGRPLPTGDLVALLLGYDQPPATSPFDEGCFRGDAIDGEGEYLYVGLGLQLVVQAWVQGASLNQACRGPQRDGETAHVDLGLPPGHGCLLRGRLLGEDRAPLATVTAALAPAAELQATAVATFRTDADGRFRVLTTTPATQLATLLVLVRSDQWLPVRRSAPLPAAGAADEVDVGDVVAPLLPVLASGRVVVDQGPLPLVSLEVQAWSDGDGTEARPAGFAATAAVSVRMPEPGAFTVVHEGAGPPPARLRLLAHAEACPPPPPLDFAPGRRDLLVALRRGAEVTVRLLVDADVAPHRDGVVAALLRGGAGEPVAELPLDGDGAEWRCRFQGLDTGVHAFELRRAGLLLCRIDGIAVGGGAAPDPRLDPFDLRGRLRALRFRLVDDGGKVLDCFGSGVLRDVGSWSEEIAFDHGVLHVLTTAPRLEVLLAGNGRQVVHWLGTGPGADLRAPARAPLAVVSDGLPGEPLRFRGELVPAGPVRTLRDAGVPQDRLRVDGADRDVEVVNGRAVFALPDAGDYRVQLHWLGPDGSTRIVGAAALPDLQPGTGTVHVAFTAAMQLELDQQRGAAASGSAAGRR